jgi:hypothetical protein
VPQESVLLINGSLEQKAAAYLEQHLQLFANTEVIPVRVFR